MADNLPKVKCTYCEEEINGVRVQCCECPDFDICLQCFAAGAEIGPHKNNHSYRFEDQGPVGIFGDRGGWSGREHLQLLDAAELYSYGNWEMVAKHVETRTADECKEEYTSRYLDGNIGKATWANVEKPILHTNLTEDEGPLSPLAMSKLPPLDATMEEAKLLGYKPHRDDFEREYDPEAEKLVANLLFEDHEEPNIESAIKLSIVDMYIRRLRERHRRKRIVRDYQLVAKYFDNLRRDPSKPLYTKEQKELRDKMKPFAQFLNSGEHERLISSIERERELRHRLLELIRYRSLGLTTQEEIIHYEQHAASFQQQMKQNKTGISGFVIPSPPLFKFLFPLHDRNAEIDQNSIEGKTMSQCGNGSGSDNVQKLYGKMQETQQHEATQSNLPRKKLKLLKNNNEEYSNSSGEESDPENFESSSNSLPVTSVSIKSLEVPDDNTFSPEQFENDGSDNNLEMDYTDSNNFSGDSGWVSETN